MMNKIFYKINHLREIHDGFLLFFLATGAFARINSPLEKENLLIISFPFYPQVKNSVFYTHLQG